MHVFARMSIPLLPEFSCLGVISAEYPEVVFEIESYMPIDATRFIMTMHLDVGPRLGELLEHWQACPLLVSFEVVGKSKDSAIVTTIQRSPERSAVRELVGHQMLPRFPVYVRGGTASGIVVTERTRLQEFFRHMKRISPGTHIDAIRTHSLENLEGLLTPSQARIFELAKSAGYWEVPRRATLRDLAQSLDLSRSTISEALALVEKKLIDEATRKMPGH